MHLHSLRVLAPGLIPVLALSLFVAGCASTLRSAAPAPVQLPDENTAFTAEVEPVRVLDAATIALVTHNFAISLTNDRIGLLQTEYLPMSSLQAARRDTLAPRLDRLRMRVTVALQERTGGQLVQIKGSYQRVGPTTGADDLIARYWLERLTQEIATNVGISYRPRITDAMYAQAALEMRRESPTAAVTSNNVVRALAIVAGLLFVVTLFSGVLTPGAAEQGG